MGFDLASIFGKGVKEAVNSVGEIADKFITTKQEKEEFKLKVEEALSKTAQAELDALLNDRQSARDMYKANSTLQKIFAVTFLISYVALSIVLVLVSTSQVALADYAIALVSTIFGGMSTKVSTITDFLFGSSMGSKEKDMAASQSIVKKS